MTEAFQTRSIVEADEEPHEHGGERDWVERLTFNFFDDAARIGGIATLVYVPGERRATGEIDVFLPGGAVATALARGADVKRADLTVGRLSFACDERMRRWRLTCTDTALVFPTAESSTLAGSTERAGKAAPLTLELAFESWTEPAGWAGRRTDVDEMRFTRVVSSGTFEQAGRFTGHVRVGAEDVPVEGHGFRARSWGVLGGREEWLAAAFGSDLAISVGRCAIGGEPVGRGALFRKGTPAALGDGARWHAGSQGIEIALPGAADPFAATGELLATIPARAGDTQVYRSMARFRVGAREVLGYVEVPELVV